MLHAMDVSAIVKAIDDRIATLRQAKDLLSATAIPATEKRAQAAVAAIRPGKTGKTAPATESTGSGRKPMSEEGRARIAAAQKKRWALKHAGATAAKKAVPAAAAKKSAPAKKSVAKKAVPAKKSAAKKAVAEPTPAEEPATN